MAHPQLPVIRAGTPIMVRPGNRLHIGIDPGRGVLLELHPHIDVQRVAALLHSLREPGRTPEVMRQARSAGLTPRDLTDILDRLVADGSAIDPRSVPGSRRPLRVRVHGRGPLSDLLGASLTDCGLLVGRSTKRSATLRALDGWECNLVVLTDFLVHDPMLVNALLIARIPHLQVRVRDDVGLVGPLVLPELTSCLRCADHHRSALDPDWPLLASQLVRRPGQASTATIRATAALAHGEIDRLATALAAPTTSDPPALLNRVLHLCPDPIGVEFTSWPPHPVCGCRPLSGAAGRAAEHGAAAG